MQHHRTTGNLTGGGRKHALTPKQQAFVSELMLDENGTRAAAAAGYKNPAVLACFLQDEEKYPLVAQAIKEARARKELAAVRKAEDVLRYIHDVMYFSPIDYFDPGGNGGWLISQEDCRRLPPEIKRLIEEVEARSVKTPTGTIDTLWVRFVSKTTAMTLAAKHQLGEKVNVSQTVVSWDVLAAEIPDTGVPDVIEEEVRKGIPGIEYKPSTNGHHAPPSTNGDGHE